MTKFSLSEKIDKARALGYSVSVAIEGYGGNPDEGAMPAVYRVEGFGVSTQIPENDESAWKSLVNEKAHEHREKSARAADPNDEFEWDDEEQMKSSLDAAVATGTMKKAEAERALKDWKAAQA